MQDVGRNVLEFYRELPFNYRESPSDHADAIRSRNQVEQYVPLVPHLGGKTAVLDVGCGAGWFALSMAWHYGCRVSGIDFNPVAIDRAKQVAQVLGSPTSFEVADLFQYEPPSRFDVVSSVGVLHHTGDCLAAVSRICTHYVKPGGHVFIGLYHRYGRRPFLDHFRRLEASGRSEQALLEEYSRLHPLQDKTHLQSWFRDQVLHPHETQHTLAELIPVLSDAGLSISATSINRFAPIEDIDSVLALEESLEQVGKSRLEEGRYYPGFFVFQAKKS